MKGGAAEGATRSNTEARGVGLGGELKGGAAEGATRSNTGNLATRLREDPEFDSRHDVICQVGDRRSPGHIYEQAGDTESLSKQRRSAKLQEEAHPDIGRPGLQRLYTRACDLLQDDARYHELVQSWDSENGGN